MSADSYNLERFVNAQKPAFASVLEELTAGRKRTHWIWFVFPQLRGLGHSPMAQFYGISSLDEARAYFAHSLLGPRLVLCTQTVVASRSRSLHDIFGSPDDMKFLSCMTLFEAVAAQREPVFGRAIERWCAGERDARTLQLISSTGTS